VGSKLPVPPTELEVKRMDESVGRPDGFGFPNSSLVVRVTEIEEPEVTESAAAETEDWDKE
jgi:hypothetical protein